MAKHRLYIDEVGNPGLGAGLTGNERYLSLTGVIVSLDHARVVVHPQIDDLKNRYFESHPDDPVILHRKDLVNQRRPFDALLDPDVKAAFDADLLGLIRNLDYTVITAVIDKLEHLNRYGGWAYDPYHYCLVVILERYALWLGEHVAQGDVMAESRGGGEDRRLKGRVCADLPERHPKHCARCLRETFHKQPVEGEAQKPECRGPSTR